jgi:hypothetical protein
MIERALRSVSARQATQISSKKFAKSFEGFWPRPNLNTALTEIRNTLQTQDIPILSTVDTP